MIHKTGKSILLGLSITTVIASLSISGHTFGQDTPIANLERDSIRTLPFDTLLNKLSLVVGLPKDNALFAPLIDAKLKLGGFDHAQGIRPDDSITPIKVSTWVEAIKPLCRSQEIKERYPKLDIDVTKFLETAYGRRITDEDIAAFDRNVAVDLPAIIEAEHYYDATELTEDNAFAPTQCEYRGMGVDVEDSPEGDCNVGQAGEGERLEYRLGAANSTYDLVIRAATQVDDARMSFRVNGDIIGTIEIKNEGWQTYSDYQISNIAIPSDAILTAVFDTNWTNFNYVYVVESGNPNNRNNINDSRDYKPLSREQNRLINCASILSSSEFKSF